MINNFLPEAILNLPHDSKVWVYQSDRLLNQIEVKMAENAVNEFLTHWQAHGKDVEGYGVVVKDAFIVLVANARNVEITGCSIDSSVNFVRELGKSLNINFFDRGKIVYLQNDVINIMNFKTFNPSSPEVVVFDANISNLKDLKTKWIVPYNQSSIKKLIETSFNFELTL